MANWSYTIDISNAWGQYQNDECHVGDVAKELAGKLKDCKHQYYAEIQMIIDVMDEIVTVADEANEHEREELEELFNDQLEILYDFADFYKIWIKKI